MRNHLVSVVIPTYNRAGVVTRAIESALAQCYHDKEIIIVDDGSTDDTNQRLSKYGKSIKVISQENSGPSVARNAGARAANGEFLAFLDSDDTWHPEKLSRQVRLLASSRTDVPCCICNAMINDHMESSRALPKTSFQTAGLKLSMNEGLLLNPAQIIASRFVLFNQVALIRRCAFERTNGFKEDLYLLEDYDLAFRLSLLGPWAFINTPLVTKFEDTKGIGVTASQDPLKHSIAWGNAIEALLSERTTNSDPKVWRLLERARTEAELEISFARRSNGRNGLAKALANLQGFLLRKRQGIRRLAPGWPRAHAVEA